MNTNKLDKQASSVLKMWKKELKKEMANYLEIPERDVILRKINRRKD